MAIQLCKMPKKKSTKKRRIWVHDWVNRREMIGASNLLLTEIRYENAQSYKMLPQKFDELLCVFEDASVE